jgi:hypothetical protein
VNTRTIGAACHSHIVNAAGTTVPNDGILSALPAPCRPYIGTTRGQILSCVGNQGWQKQIVYHPANRFWIFQGIESGIFVALAAALVTTAFIVIRRDA